MAADGNTEQEFKDTPEGWASRFKLEFDSARKALKDWHDQAERTIKAYLDDRDGESSAAIDRRWNLYTADTQTKQAILFGNPPRTAVTRMFADAQDDVARVAAEILERVLNTDIEGSDDTFTQAVGLAHEDRELAAFGLCRVRYDIGETVKEEARPPKLGPDGRELAAAVPAIERRPNEQVETDWVPWDRVLWSPCRAWHEVSWLALAGDWSPRTFSRRFGEKLLGEVPFLNKTQRQKEEQRALGPWDRIRVWEVWVKDVRQVFFCVEGYGRVLTPMGVPAEKNGGVPDPLGLKGFWPCPQPMMANVTTSKLVPKPDREFAKDLYDGVNVLSTRIALLEEAVSVRGVFDKVHGAALGQLLDGTTENKMIPVDGFAMLAEKGGLRGVVDWFPVEQVVNALQVLREQRTEQIEAIRQITGMADIMRGQSADAGATATEQRIKARFGSVRMERRQKELARFVSDLQRLRAEVMAKHFDETTILARCNCANTPDAGLAPQAVRLIKSDIAKYRIEVKPEVISMTDFDALKQERTEIIGSVSQFLTAAAPLAQAVPGSMPHLLRMLQWMVSGLRGASEIEGVLDQAISEAQAAPQQAQQQQQPDPKLLVQQLKGQQDQAKIQAESMADQQRIASEVQADEQREANQAKWNILEARAKSQISAATRASQPQPLGPNGKPRGMP